MGESLTARRGAESSGRAASALVLLRALDMFEAASTAPKDRAVEYARAVALTFTDEELRTLVVALAVEAVWGLPPAPVRPRSAEEMRARLVQVEAWVRRVRLEATWAAS